MSGLCPGTDGACVYQARALHNAVFRDALDWPVCSGSGARPYEERGGGERSAQLEKPAAALHQTWKLNLFPNPAANKITLVSNIENESLHVVINDLSGRNAMKQDVKLNGNLANLDLSLLNGAYIVSITNSAREVLIKKLIIAK